MKQCVFQILFWLFFVIFESAYAPDGPGFPVLDEHTCPGEAWVAEGDEFRETGKRHNAVKPARTYMNLEFPYVFLHGLKQGQTLFLRGRVQDGAKKIHVTLAGGNPGTKAAAVVLEMKFIISDGKIYFNSRKNGKWFSQKEVKSPLESGGEFDLSVHALESKFEIRVNKMKLYEYWYLMSLDYINFIDARYDMDLDQAFIGGQIFEIPYKIDFPNGHLGMGESVKFNGEAAYLPFIINIYNTNGDKLFYLETDFDKRKVYRNAFVDGEWSGAEDEGGFPFEMGAEFEMSIQNSRIGLVLWVDGKLFTLFIHRTENPGTAYNSIEFTEAFEMRTLNVCKA